MLTKEIMTDHVVTIESDKTVLDACNKFKDYGVGCLIVTKGGNVVGIVTETDLSRTIDVFSGAIDELIDFYTSSKNSIEKIIDDWGDLLIKLKGYKKLEDDKELHILKEEV